MARKELLSSFVMGGGSLGPLLLTPAREHLEEGTPNISALHSLLQEMEEIHIIDPLIYIKIAVVNKSVNQKMKSYAMFMLFNDLK